MLRPLEQWICDTCHELIEKPRDGYLEWLSGGGGGDIWTIHGFRIVHHSPRSPRQPDGNCYRYTRHPDRQDLDLDVFVGPDGLGRLLSWLALAPGQEGPSSHPDNPGELVELIRRLHLPHYEEARLYFNEARGDGFLDDGDPADWFRQQTLLHIIDRYGRDR
jgi:hypothetical protein